MFFFVLLNHFHQFVHAHAAMSKLFVYVTLAPHVKIWLFKAKLIKIPNFDLSSCQFLISLVWIVKIWQVSLLRMSNTNVSSIYIHNWFCCVSMIPPGHREKYSAFGAILLESYFNNPILCKQLLSVGGENINNLLVNWGADIKTQTYGKLYQE